MAQQIARILPSAKTSSYALFKEAPRVYLENGSKCLSMSERRSGRVRGSFEAKVAAVRPATPKAVNRSISSIRLAFLCVTARL